MSVNAFFKGKTILLTGCTGFLGKVILEKVLRAIPEIELIFILIRQKKGSSLMERFKREVLGSQCFDRLRIQLGSDFDDFIARKIKPIEGDMLKENIGLSERDLGDIVENANVVINCAASVDFNARLDDAIMVNVKGTQRIFELSCKIKNLKNFVHVSTAYVNSDKTGWVEEKIYDSEISDPLQFTQKLLDIPVQTLLETTPEIIGGYPNTYTFTKNLAERLLKQLRPKGFPLTIIRPSIIGCSFRDPIPGWIDSLVASAAIFFFTGMGLVKVLYGDEDLIGDNVPVDFVVDYILVSTAFTNSHDGIEVIHCTSSARNPITWRMAKQGTVSFWRQNPTPQQLGKPSLLFVKSKRLYNLVNQNRLIPAKVFEKFSKYLGNTKMKMQANRLMKVLTRAEHLNNTFEFFINNEWIYDSGKTQLLLDYLTPAEKKVFFIDINELKWIPYINLFNHGLQRFILKENVKPFSIDQNVLPVSKSSYFSDIEWAMTNGQNFNPKSNREHISLVMNSARVQAVIKQLVDEKAKKQRGPVNYQKIQKDLETEALDTCKVMFADYNMPVLRTFGWFMTKVFRRIYEKVVIDEETLKKIQEYDPKVNGPLVLIPTHRSYIDFLICSYVFFASKIRCPHIATAEDFLNMTIIPKILRCSGAFFLKRKQMEDNILYKTIFYEYVQRLLQDECYLEFFIEGTRSRSGKTLSPKLGLLGIVNDAVHEGKIIDANILPIAISYEKVLEADTYPYELLGEEKVKESLLRVIKAARILSTNFGRIYINFSTIISVKQFSLEYDQPQDKTLQYICNDQTLRKRITIDMAYKITYSMMDGIVVMPTSMVATFLLMNRRGIQEDVLTKRMEWLAQQLQLRGAKTASLQVGQVDATVRNTINLLSDIIIKSKKNIFELQVQPNLEYKNILLLSYYRNQLLHHFVQEGIICCALTAFGHQISFNEGVSTERLWEETEFLLKLLKREFVLQKQIRTFQDFQYMLELMVQRQVLQIQNGIVKAAQKNGEWTLQFLCSFIWPLIESYWVTLIYLYQVERNGSFIDLKKLIQQIQWFAESLHEERVMDHYESCSQETIKNAVSIYKDIKIITIKKEEKDEIVIVPKNEIKNIVDLENQLQKFLKNSFVKSIQAPFDMAKKAIIDYQFAAKL